MNGAHDLRGMHGFGPVKPEPEAEEPVFHAAWEKQVFGLTLAAGFLGQWNLDMSRFARERQYPAAYLQHSYYENWLAGLETLLVEAGLVTRAELATGKAVGPADENLRRGRLQAGEVAEALAKGSPVETAVETLARFKAGDRVRAVNQHPAGHTREPGYVRGRAGIVYEHYGTHIFPDAHANGSKVGRHLYCVRSPSRSISPNAAISPGPNGPRS